MKPPDLDENRPDSRVSLCSFPGSGKSTEKSKRPGQTWRFSSWIVSELFTSILSSIFSINPFFKSMSFLELLNSELGSTIFTFLIKMFQILFNGEIDICQNDDDIY